MWTTRALKNTRVAVPLMLLLLTACASSSKSGSATTSSVAGATTTTLSPAQLARNQSALKDVAVTSCAPNVKGDLVIMGKAHNTTGDRAGYTIQIAIGDKTGKKLDATAASVDGLEPGTTGTWTAVTSAPYQAGMTCKVTSVSVQTGS